MSSDTNVRYNELNRLYVMFNLGASIISYEDTNDIYINGVLNTTLSKQQRLNLNLNEGDVVESLFPITGTGRIGSSQIALLPEYTKGKFLQGSVSRDNDTEIKIRALDNPATVEVFNDNVLETTINVPANTLATYTNPDNGAWRLNSDEYIIAYLRTGNSDPHFMPSGSDTIIGTSSRQLVASSFVEEANTTFTCYNNTATNTVTENGIGVSNINFPPNRNHQHPESATHSVNTDGKRLFGRSYADADGNCSAANIPTSQMAHTFCIPTEGEFVTFINRSGLPIREYDVSGALIGTQTPTKTNGDNLAWYAYQFGTPNNANNIPSGTMYSCDEKMYAVYQSRELSVFSIRDDEVTLMCTDRNYKI